MTEALINPTSAKETPPRIALGVSGGIAAYKAAEVLRGLQQAGCEVRVGMTKRATEFIQPLTFRALSGAHVVVDDYAPDNPDPIAHITFSQTIDLFIVAPATANIIAKFANGIADDFLTSTYLAATAPVLIAPAMNTTMWEHPATCRNLARLREDGVHIVEPDAGEMACGTIGQGRLSDPANIVRAALAMLAEQHQRGTNGNTDAQSGATCDLRGERILITAGGTREAIDPVRFIGNRSSGRMGFALAEAAAARGANITLIAGTTTAPLPSTFSANAEAIRTVRVVTAAEMHTATTSEIESATIFIAAAAVADYRPSEVHPRKIKKSDRSLTLTLEPTTDILAEVSRFKRERHADELLVIGFAAETDDALAHGKDKLHRKNLDMIVVNDVSQEGAGFDSDTNIVTLLRADTDAPIALPMLTKRRVADRILDEIVTLRRTRMTPALAEQSA